jgi:GntR family transcriptional regulator
VGAPYDGKEVASRLVGPISTDQGADRRHIDRRSPIPYYYQLQEILKEEIERAAWRPGELLPSEAELERRFGVSRTVIRKALDVLQSDGQIVRVKGKGSIVAEPKFRWEATASAGDWQRGDPAPRVSVGRLVDQRRIIAGGRVGRLLGVKDEATVFELTYTQEVDHRAVALSQMYLRTQASPALADLAVRDVPPPLLADGGGDALTQLAERYGVVAAISQVTVEMTAVNDFEADLLAVGRASPAFLLSALDLDQQDAPVAFTRSVVRADQVRFSLTLRRDQPSGAGWPQSLTAFVTQAPARSLAGERGQAGPSGRRPSGTA